VSDIARLTRLGLFGETIRVFFRAVKETDEKAYEAIPDGIRKRHGGEEEYADARKEDRARRLTVAARDVWRLVNRFERHPNVTAREEWALLKRLLEEQCEIRTEPPPSEPGSDDAGEEAAPVEPKEAKAVESDSLQTPHDPDTTYSGHKGKGYTVQVMETCGEGNPVQLITEVEVTRSCDSDAKATTPMVEAVIAAGHKPEEGVADTTYSGAENASALAEKGVNLLAPAPARGKPEEGKTYPEPEAKCPKTREGAGEWLRRQEASATFAKRYATRAAIEGTISEGKRAHGAGRLRVRREGRVKLATYFKWLACNVKRALRYWLNVTFGGSPAAATACAEGAATRG
jgi:hypothetical protein